jgi:hypothetical protein
VIATVSVPTTVGVYVAVYVVSPVCSVTAGLAAFAPVTATANRPATPGTLFPNVSTTVIVTVVTCPAVPFGTTAVLLSAFAAPALTALANGLPPMCVPLNRTETASLPLTTGV